MASEQRDVRFNAGSRPTAVLNRLARPLMAAGLWPRLDAARLLASARRKAGREQTLSLLFEEAFTARTHAFAVDAHLSPLGVLALRKQLRHSLDAAYEMSRALEERPEARAEKIDRPVFILGLPRTGTTLMQRLLCCHPGARYLPFWELYTPVPKDLSNPAADLPRRHREAKASLRLLRWFGPELMAIHPMEWDDPEECYHLFRNVFLVPPGFDFGDLTSYWRWFEALPDKAELYRAFKLQLQILQHMQCGEHWLLKCPLHLAVLPELLEVFPDARIVYTERDPVQSIASLASLAAVTWAMTSDEVDLKRVGRYALEASAASERRARRAAATLGANQLFEVHYDALLADPIGQATAISKRFGHTVTPEFVARMRQWLDRNPSTKHGRHGYDLEMFGLDAGEIRSVMAEARRSGEPDGERPLKAASLRS